MKVNKRRPIDTVRAVRNWAMLGERCQVLRDIIFAYSPTNRERERERERNTLLTLLYGTIDVQ